MTAPLDVAPGSTLISEPGAATLPTAHTPYVIAEEWCGDCGESIGYDLRPLTLRCWGCALDAGLLFPPAPNYCAVLS